MRRLLSSPYVKGAVGAIVGSLLFLLLIHLWSDHLALHALVDYVTRSAEKINKLP